jgi:hypothetical protein
MRDTFYIVDVDKLRDSIGQAFVTHMVADGDIQMAPDGRDIIRRERFSDHGWKTLNLKYRLIGPEYLTT